MISFKYLNYATVTLLLVFLCFVLTGCGGSSTGRARVEGSVTLDGQPVDGGTITFAPEEYKGAGIERASVTADIKNGKYSVDAPKGAVPGKYRVEIYWKQKTGNQVADPDTGKMVDAVIDVIPTFYGKDSTTKVDIQASDNKFDYPLISKAGAPRKPARPPRD